MAKHGNTAVLTERDINEEIAKVAYELYKKRGMSDGHDFEDWIKAETIVSKEFGRLRKNEIDLMDKAVDKEIAKRSSRRIRKS